MILPWRAPGFWGRRYPTLTAWLLAPLGWIYGQVTALRMKQSARVRAGVPVICVGNFVTGGTGKTPFAIALADLATTRGYRPVFLLRGYGGRIAGPVQVDPALHSAADVGDEALLLAARAPTVAARDRAAGAQLAEHLGNLILMDDGFQNPSLAKDLSLVLVDMETGIGNQLCIPAGPLRAPLSVQLAHADAVIGIGSGSRGICVLEAARSRGLPVLHAYAALRASAQLNQTRIVCFAGIGRPEKVFETARAAGAQVVAAHGFPDHHAFTEADAQALLACADAHGAALVTTTKDHIRLATAKTPALTALRQRCRVMEIDMQITEPDTLLDLLPPPRKTA